ncbi:ATP binding protein [Aureococcus anophagefferens]|nr:ATP binding protein [Aureococcus anophagefferens]
MKTYNIENEHNITTTVVKIDNDLDTDDAMALVSFFVFMFALILLGLLIYYGSSLKLWWRQSVVFPIRRLCCEKERKRLWRLHKDAVIRADRALAGARESDPSLLEEAPSSEDPLERALDSLVGLEPLKEEIRALRRTLVVEQQRRNVLNLGGDGKKRKAARVSAPHMTALKTRAVINRAKGGVLFVDEAYALTPGTSAAAGRDFGAEAVQELMRDLTSGDPVVILAGYPREMERFLNVNPGLSRRFQVRFTFADYSIQQLAAIFVKIADRNGFRLGRDCSAAHLEHVLSTHFPESLCRKWNGGLPEGLFRRAQDALAKRLNVLTMSAEARRHVRGPRAAPDDDDDMYEDDEEAPAPDLSAALETENPLHAILQSLGADGLPFDKLKNVPARLDRLERSLNGLILANQAQVNPWAAPAPAP